MENFFLRSLEGQEKKGLSRQPRLTTPLSPPLVEREGKVLINFSSNDYLGLSRHPSLIEGAKDALLKWGAGSGSSRFITGELPLFQEIEEKLALLKQKEAALLFNTGFLANSSVLSTLTASSVVFYDQYCHRSILEGCLKEGRKSHRFRHNNLEHLETLLKKYGSSQKSCWIITESVFSMDGDLAPLEDLILLAKKYKAFLFVDEAHATGVFGENGMGLTVGKEVDVVLGTFSKGLGCFGAYIACSHLIKKYLLNFCPGLIFTTALPPSVLGAQKASLELVPTLNKEREKIKFLSLKLSAGCKAIGWQVGATGSQIVPLIVGPTQLTLDLSHQLEEMGFLVSAIRPPTVPPNQSRLRISLSSMHSENQLDKLLDTLKILAKSNFL